MASPLLFVVRAARSAGLSFDSVVSETAPARGGHREPDRKSVRERSGARPRLLPGLPWPTLQPCASPDHHPPRRRGTRALLCLRPARQQRRPFCLHRERPRNRDCGGPDVWDVPVAELPNPGELPSPTSKPPQPSWKEDDLDSDTLTVEWVATTELHPNPANPSLNDAAVGPVSDSLPRFGRPQPF